MSGVCRGDTQPLFLTLAGCCGDGEQSCLLCLDLFLRCSDLLLVTLKALVLCSLAGISPATPLLSPGHWASISSSARPLKPGGWACPLLTHCCAFVAAAWCAGSAYWPQWHSPALVPNWSKRATWWESTQCQVCSCWALGTWVSVVKKAFLASSTLKQLSWDRRSSWVSPQNRATEYWVLLVFWLTSPPCQKGSASLHSSHLCLNTVLGFIVLLRARLAQTLISVESLSGLLACSFPPTPKSSGYCSPFSEISWSVSGCPKEAERKSIGMWSMQ